MSHQDEAFEQSEAEIRRTRAPTRTLAQCLRVFVSFPSPATITVLILATAGWRLWLGAFDARELIAFAAVAVWWPFQEWAAHRWILHLRPIRVGRFVIDPYFARRHRQHHSRPSHFADIFLPVQVVVGAWFGFLAVFWPLLGLEAGVTALWAVSTAALVYEWTHFSAHTDRVPVTAWGRRIVRNHRLHHHLNEQHWFAFTVPQLDDWFDTGGEPADVPRSETVRTLGV